jgi:beta-mannosidase
LFCGNNELEVAWKNWGWQKKYNYTEQQQQEIWKGYQTLFHEMIPKNIQNIAPEIPYIPSSPISNWGKPEDFNSGDNHDWRVWHGEMYPDVFYTHIPRFASEFGAPSLPSVTVLEEYFKKPVSEIRENELQALVYSYKGWRLLKKYIEQEYGTINSTEAWIYFSQHFQAEAMQKAIESHRFNPARCGGSLVWQLNDIDPVISWSLFDKNNIAKQAWYSVQKNFASSLLYFKNTTDSIQLWYAAKEGSEEEIRIRFMHRDGIVYSDQKQKVRSNANPICIAQFAKNDLHSKGNLDEIFLVAQLPQQAYQSPRTKIQLFVPFQKFRWKKQDIEIIPTENQNHFVLKSSSLQGSVYMPLPKNLHPNYTPYVLNRFDLIPGDSLIMELPLPQGISISEFTKTWKSLNYFYSTKM